MPLLGHLSDPSLGAQKHSYSDEHHHRDKGHRDDAHDNDGGDVKSVIGHDILRLLNYLLFSEGQGAIKLDDL